jgi:hypothetical protein
MSPMINGPFRGWYGGTRHLTEKSEFTESDIVWWTQYDACDSQYPPYAPGSGIDEVESSWDYFPKNQGDPDLYVQYQTYLGNRYGKFIFPASFLNNGTYTISCNIVNRLSPPETYQNSWTVTVNKDALFQI